MTKKKTLITGAAGFIGYHLAERLIRENHEVTGLDNINDYYDVNLKLDRLKETGIYPNEVSGGSSSQVEGQRSKAPGKQRIIKVKSKKYENYAFYKMDLNDRQGMEELFETGQFDVVIHLAAQAGVRYSLEHPHAYIDSNVSGFLNILEGCRHHPVDHLIYASSSSVYGENEQIPFNTSHNVDHPVSLYAATKKSNELMAHTYSHLFGIPVTGLRFFTVYGPWGRPDMALFKFADLMTDGKPIDVYNHGDMSRDFTYVDDIVESVVRLIPEAPAKGRAKSGGEARGGSGKGMDSGKMEQGKRLEMVPGKESKEEPDKESANTPRPDLRSGVSPSRKKNRDRRGENAVPQEEMGVPYRLFNIGHGSPVHLLEFIETLEKHLGIEAEKNMLPMQPGDVPRTWADVEDLFSVIDYRPRVKLDEGIREFVRWYKGYYLR
jgi:UDP-glucuronate 4-epimerase